MKSMAKKQKNPDNFWREYEAKTGEKILARTLGQYVSGWEEFDRLGGNPLWGLIIASSGGFRFHHFPQTNWFDALTRFGADDNPPQEKTIFIPAASLVSAVLHKETKWYKKWFFATPPRLVIRYRTEAGSEKELLLYAEHKPDGIAEALCPVPVTSH